MLAEPPLERLRRSRGPFASDDDLLLAAFYDEREYGALKAAGPIDTHSPIADRPLVTLVRALAGRKDLASVHILERGQP